MRLDYRTTCRKGEGHLHSRLVAATFGLMVLIPGLAWTCEADVVSCASAAHPQVGLTLPVNAGQFTGDCQGLSCAASPFAPGADSDLSDDQSSGAGQVSSGSSQASAPPEDQKQQVTVNPLTGMAVASSSNYTPLTGRERWKLYLEMTYASAGPYLSPVVNALALDQANGTPRQWGGGFPGFGRRLASRVGNAVLQGTFQAPLAALFHEDVRYIPSNHHSFQRRALHAVLYSFLTYNNKGHPTLNIANLTAYYASTAVTTAWLPGIGNAARYTFVNSSEQIALSFPLNVVQEFWPEIRRSIFRRH